VGSGWVGSQASPRGKLDTGVRHAVATICAARAIAGTCVPHTAAPACAKHSVTTVAWLCPNLPWRRRRSVPLIGKLASPRPLARRSARRLGLPPRGALTMEQTEDTITHRLVPAAPARVKAQVAPAPRPARAKRPARAQRAAPAQKLIPKNISSQKNNCPTFEVVGQS
jgi:hypothetical protein